MWLFQTHSDFVTAAYLITAGGVSLLIIQSLARYRRLRHVIKELQHL